MEWEKIIVISGLVCWSMNMVAPRSSLIWRIFSGLMVIFMGVSIYLDV